MRRVVPLAIGLLFFCPHLAHADALDGSLLVLELLAAVAGVAVLGMGLSVLAYRQPGSQTLAVISHTMNAMGLLLGLIWEWTFGQGSGGGLSNLTGFNPFLSLSVPFAVWLWVANKVAYRSPAPASTWAVAVALVGAGASLRAGLYWAVRGLLTGAYVELYGSVYWQWLVSPAVLFGIWWLVLRQVQRFRPLGWSPGAMWLVPAQVLLLNTLWTYLPLFSILPQMLVDRAWFTQLLSHSLLSYGIGVLAIWLNQRRQPAPEPAV